MTLAYDYPLLSLMLSMAWFFLLVIWIMTMFHVIVDIFRSRDLRGVAKAGWLLFVIVLPLLGVFVYLISRGDKMAEHAARDAQARDAAFESSVRDAAGASGTAGELAQLASLRDSGAITEAEFAAGKAKILT